MPNLKPSNIMVTPDGRVKILDVGLAKRLRWRRISATFRRDSSTRPGHSFASGGFTRLYESHMAASPIFLNDGRRLIFQEGSKIMLIDRVTRAVCEVINVAPDTFDIR